MKQDQKEKMLDVVQASQKEIQADHSMTHGRRAFLKNSVAMAGGAGMLGTSALASAQSDVLPIPESNKVWGKPMEEAAYGRPSKYESKVVRRRTDVFVNRQNYSDWSMTPIQSTPGIAHP